MTQKEPKHYPPSALRYMQNNPAVNIRIPSALLERIESISKELHMTKAEVVKKFFADIDSLVSGIEIAYDSKLSRAKAFDKKERDIISASYKQELALLEQKHKEILDKMNVELERMKVYTTKSLDIYQQVIGINGLCTGCMKNTRINEALKK